MRTAMSALTSVMSDIAASTMPGCHHALSVACPMVSVRAGTKPAITAAIE